MKRFQFLKAFNSPFKRPLLKWYFGKVKLGTPYFLPRRWKKPSHKEARKLALKKYREWGLKLLENPKLRSRSYQDFYDEIMRSQIAVPRKIGFDFVGLGWKTKWSDKDIRFEWSPLISFVLFKWQIALMIIPENQDRYWEAWLYWELYTDKTKSTRERVEQCKSEFSQTWTRSDGKTETTINYYDKILKSKWR